LIAFVVALQKPLAIRLLELIRVAVPSVDAPVPAVTVSVPIKMRTLRIVILPARAIILARVQTVLVTLLRGNLVHVVVSAVPAIPIVPAILPVIRILIVWPALRAGGGDYTDAHEE